MKELRAYADATCISEPLLGKVTFTSHFIRADYILVAPEANKAKRGYALTISSAMPAEVKELLESTKPEAFTSTSGTAPAMVVPEKMVFCLRDDLAQLHEGDVILVEPHGHIVVLIEVQAKANYLSLTDRCNHRCVMCPQPPVVHEKSRLEHNLRLIALMDKNTNHVGITGGEPTLVGDDLITVLQALNKKVPHAAITMLSNAVKLADLNFVRKIASCGCEDLQVDVPLFAATPELHNSIVGAKTFYKTVKGLYNLAQCQIPVGIRVVIHRMNYEHLQNLAYFIYHNFPFVRQVAFMQMETTGLAREHIEALWVDPYDYKDQLSDAVNYLRLRRIDTLIFNAQLCVLNDDVRDIAMQSISEWKNILLPECTNCAKKSSCAGFFASQDDYHSAHIQHFVV